MTKPKVHIKVNAKQNAEAKLRRLTINEMAFRNAVLASLGSQFSGDRNIYTALGYPAKIEAKDYFAQYFRNAIAAAVIDRPAKDTWRGSVVVRSAEGGETDPLEKAWKDLDWKLKLKSIFLRADKLSNIGRFGILLLGFNDTASIQDYANEVKPSATLKLLYVTAHGELTTTVATTVSEPTDPRYGLPLTYNVTKVGGNTIQVHYSRVIHITGETLEDPIYGLPFLEKVYNRLLDIEKIVGGDAEGYWRGARPGYAALMKDDYELDTEVLDDMDDQMEQYEHNMRRFIMGEGMDVQSLAQQVANPKDNVDVQMTLISAATGIPKRILMGSERGELASSQDSDNWASIIELRREDFAENQILGILVDRLMTLGILPKVEQWAIDWTPLTVTSEKEKAEVGQTRANALKAYGDSPMAQEIMPPQMFMKYVLGLSDDQIAEITEASESYISEEDEAEEEILPPAPVKKVEPEDDEDLIEIEVE